tara:strand:- start:993 stop:1967 length:975 start_codon:yes stop_codon:yes gene_type:complete
MDEYEVIKKIFRPLSFGNNLSLNLDDDVCFLPNRNQIILGTDSIVEGDHFEKNERNPSLIAKKLLRVNLSDLASKGVSPFGYTLNLSLPKKLNNRNLITWIKSFARGLKEDQKKYNIKLLGGDTVIINSNLILSLTLFGFKKKKIIKRSDAIINDDIYVTGNIGESGIGFKIVKKKLKLNKILNTYFLKKYKLPEPPVFFGNELFKFANSATDISDGLLADLNNINLSSKCGAKIFIDNIPFSNKTIKIIKDKKVSIDYLITCGEDYQIIFTSKKKNSKKILSYAKKKNIKITKIGEVIKKRKLIVLDNNNKELFFENLGFQHF